MQVNDIQGVLCIDILKWMRKWYEMIYLIYLKIKYHFS